MELNAFKYNASTKVIVFNPKIPGTTAFQKNIVGNANTQPINAAKTNASNPRTNQLITSDIYLNCSKNKYIVNLA